MTSDDPRPAGGLRRRLHEVIFESDTAAGKAFDVALIVAIVASVVVVMLDSVKDVNEQHAELLGALEWAFTILFTIEYVVRLYCAGRPLRYARSFFGLVDLFSILPTYVSLVLPGAQALLTVRTLRILRVFRVLKLANYLSEIELLARALAASRRKITVFVAAVMSAVVILGTLMYLVEGVLGENPGFSSIPMSIYWAVVTLTTVGYGDIAPTTAAGQFLATIIMLLGYGLIAVPTGIVTVEVGRAGRGPAAQVSGQSCPQCVAEGHDVDAVCCKFCGARL